MDGEDAAGPAEPVPGPAVTLRYLVTRPAPAHLPLTRLPFERHIFRVVDAVTLVRPEDDGNYHLVLRDPNGSRGSKVRLWSGCFI